MSEELDKEALRKARKAEKYKAWRDANREQELERRKAWRAANKDAVSVRNRLYVERLAARAGAVIKVCKACGVEKTMAEFSVRKASPDGKHHYCKQCDSARLKAWRVANPDRVAAAQIPRRLASPAHKAYVKSLRLRQTRELHFEYLAGRLMYPQGVKVMGRKDITPELIELKREQLTAYRLSKQIKNQLKGKNESI